MLELNHDNPILEWKGAKPEDEKLAQKVAKKVGELYFTYNLPLQVNIVFNDDEKPESGIDIDSSVVLNYMPRKERCERISLRDVFMLDENVTAQDIKDLMRVSAVILEHLAEQFKKFDPSKNPKSVIVYPN